MQRGEVWVALFQRGEVWVWGDIGVDVTGYLDEIGGCEGEGDEGEEGDKLHFGFRLDFGWSGGRVNWRVRIEVRL